MLTVVGASPCGPLILAAIIAGVTAFDNVHAFQWLLSRPVIIGPIIGYAMGDVASGMLCGAWIELVWLGVLPIGNYTPPDAHITAVTSATAAILWGGGVVPALIAILLFIPMGIISKLVDLQLRHHLAVHAERLLETEPPYRISSLLPLGLFPVFAKAALMVLIAGVVAITISPIIELIMSNKNIVSGLTLSASLVPALGMVQLARCIGAKGRERWMLLGTMIAALVILIAVGFL